MDRRDFLAAGTFAMLAAQPALAQTASSPKAAVTTATGDFSALLASAGRCVSTGLVCIKHCEQELAAGRKELAECLGSVLDLVAACDALQKFAAYKSAYTRDFAKLTAKVCADCAKICEKHMQHMEACKNCREACLECEKACLAA